MLLPLSAASLNIVERTGSAIQRVKEFDMGYLSLEDIYPDDVEKYGHLRVGMTDLYVKDNHAIYGVVTDLNVAIRQFITAHNEHSAKPFKWNKTAEAIISSVHKAKLSVIKNKLMN